MNFFFFHDVGGGGQVSILVSLLYYTHSLLKSALLSNVGRDGGIGNDFCVYEKHYELVHFYTLR